MWLHQARSLKEGDFSKLLIYMMEIVGSEGKTPFESLVRKDGIND